MALVGLLEALQGGDSVDMASDESKDAAMEAQGGSGEPAAGASGAMKDVPFDARDLTGRTVLITGASRGLGKVLAVNLAGRGVGCLVLVARGEAALEETAVACRGVDGASAELRTLVCSCDLGGGPKEVKRLMDVVGEGGITKIDVLVANAGSTCQPSRAVDAGCFIDTTYVATRLLQSCRATGRLPRPSRTSLKKRASQSTWWARISL